MISLPQITRRVEEALQTIHNQIVGYEYYYNSSPSYIAILTDKKGNLFVRSHQGTGGFIDVSRGEMKEIFRIDTSNYESELTDAISKDLIEKEIERYSETEQIKETFEDEDRYDRRRENLISQRIYDTVESVGGIESLALQAIEWMKQQREE